MVKSATHIFNNISTQHFTENKSFLPPYQAVAFNSSNNEQPLAIRINMGNLPPSSQSRLLLPPLPNPNGDDLKSVYYKKIEESV